MPHLDIIAISVWTVVGAVSLVGFYAISLFILHHRWS